MLMIQTSPNAASTSGQGDEAGDNESEIIDLSNIQDSAANSDTGTILRRSQRNRRPVQRNLADDITDSDEKQSSNVEIGANIRQSKRTRTVEAEVVEDTVERATATENRNVNQVVNIEFEGHETGIFSQRQQGAKQTATRRLGINFGRR
ncbi:LOW QUALITY PROTEIN: hypothetical protein ACHAXM_003074 [Skeletonema potamos]